MFMYTNIVPVIPAYEPGNQLLQLVGELVSVFSHIIIVNDGSRRDESKRVLKTISDRYNSVTMINHVVNQGKGRAIKTAINYCLDQLTPDECSGIITVDADGQHVKKDIIRCAEELTEHNNDIILGCRSFAGKDVPFRSKFGNIVSKYVYRWACGVNVSDTQTGLRGVPRAFFKIALWTQGERYEYETNMLVSAKEADFLFREVDIETIYEQNNATSHFNPIRDSVRIYLVVIKYVLSSLATVLVDYSTFYMFISTGMSIMVSTYLARCCAAVVNFVVNREIVFKNKDKMMAQFLKYLLLVFSTGTISGLIVSNLSEMFGGHVFGIKIVIEFVLFLFNYYIQSQFIFRRKNSRNAE